MAAGAVSLVRTVDFHYERKFVLFSFPTQNPVSLYHVNFNVIVILYGPVYIIRKYKRNWIGLYKNEVNLFSFFVYLVLFPRGNQVFGYHHQRLAT